MLSPLVKKKIKQNNEERYNQANRGREINDIEEVKLHVETLLEILFKYEIINNREYQNTLAKNTNEYSKATAFQERDSEV